MIPTRAMTSTKALDLIVTCEVSSEVYYNQKLSMPTWPQGASGVTIGIGYDCGYHTGAEIRADWSGKLSVADINTLASCAGIKGAHAGGVVSQLGHINVPYAAAEQVFLAIDMPQTCAEVLRVWPNAISLPDDSFGALVSLVFNRGSDCSNTPTRAEMYGIQLALAAKDYSEVGPLIYKMRRLWLSMPNLAGLVTRREDEAELYDDGLSDAGMLPPPVVVPAPVAPAKHQPTTAAPAKPTASPQPKDEASADDLNEQELNSLQGKTS